MAKDTSYHAQQNIIKTEKLRNVLHELPPFSIDFFRSIEDTTSVLTRLNYAYDLRIFFNYLKNETIFFSKKNILSLEADDLNQITLKDLEVYFEYLSYYSTEDDKMRENRDRGKSRKIASLRSFFKYYYKKGILTGNISTLLQTPKIHEKPIIRLSGEEISHIISIANNGDNLTDTQKRYHKITQLRDTAIITLFLSTGIRVSELVGLNISDLDFKKNAFVVTRKGGNRVILYFNDQTARVINDYLDERKAGSDYTLSSPLFMSIQKKRMCVKSVENLVKKYAKVAAPLKKISPHKLRSTYGTLLYNNTGDIYLVADVLGHKDVNTTRKHYAAITENKRKLAATAVDLEKDNDI